MISFPTCKINLGLRITEKRSDGFHNLESCFYPIQWKDMVEVIKSPVLKFTHTGIPIPNDPKGNLCLQVWEKLHTLYSINPVHIHLHKTIPIGAGLGGGSADAAFTLKTLNQLFELKISEDEMEDILKPLGSDCAFFVRNKPVLAFGKGDEFRQTALSLKGKWIILVQPNIHVSTAEAYAGIRPKFPETKINEVISMDWTQWKYYLKNDFENHLFEKYPELIEIKKNLYHSGAVYASMTGSGSCMYGLFDQEPNIKLTNTGHIIKKALMD
jgi:4-diphosphocytidyl-2-C-methyl-D-erythritol kinase